MEDPKVSNSIAVLTFFVALNLRSNIFVSKYTTLKKKTENWKKNCRLPTTMRTENHIYSFFSIIRTRTFSLVSCHRLLRIRRPSRGWALGREGRISRPINQLGENTRN